MKSLFVIESPFQLLSAIEAKENFNLENSLLIVRYIPNNESNSMQIDKLLSFYKWSNIIKVISSSFVLSNIRLLFLLKKLQKEDFDMLFIGEYRSSILRSFFYNINTRNQYILDDGAATIASFKCYIDNHKIIKFEYSRWKKYFYIFFYRINSLEYSGRLSLKFFTIFDICNQYKVVNNFTFLKQKLSNKVILHNCVYFFGAPLSEKNVLPREEELFFLEEIIKYFQIQDVKIVYIPHRGDSQEKILKISSLSNVNILRFENPAELELLNLDKHPEIIASFYSTILQTLPKIYNFQTLLAFQIPENSLNIKYSKSIKEVYKALEKEMLVIDLGKL